MTVFTTDSRGVEAWGPTASVDVRISGLGNFIGDSWLLTNMSVGANEIVDVRQCFNDVAYIYALGNRQSSCRMSLTFAIFIGRRCNSGNENTQAISDGLSAYVKSRISKSNGPISVTVGKFSRMGWLDSIEIGNIDASAGVCSGTLNFIMELS